MELFNNLIYGLAVVNQIKKVLCGRGCIVLVKRTLLNTNGKARNFTRLDRKYWSTCSIQCHLIAMTRLLFCFVAWIGASVWIVQVAAASIAAYSGLSGKKTDSLAKFDHMF